MQSSSLRVRYVLADRAPRTRRAALSVVNLANGPPPAQTDLVGGANASAARRQIAAGALAITNESPFPGINAAVPALEQPDQKPAKAAVSSDGSLLRRVIYGVNGGLLGSAGLALLAAHDASLLGLFPAQVQAYASGVAGMYASVLSAHPVALKAAISAIVFSLGDLTAQAYEGKGVSQVDWARTARSGSVGLIAQGPLSHWAFSSDGCLIDSLVDQAQGLEDWQQPLAKIAVDQTAFSLAWNSMYFALLGAMRLDSPGAIFADLRSSGFSLMRAGWRLWPLAHLITYTLVPSEHRLLFVDMVELAWVTVLVVWSQQTAANEAEVLAEADVYFATAAEAAVEPAFMAEQSASQEMRAGLLMDGGDSETDAEQGDSAWQPEQNTS